MFDWNRAQIISHMLRVLTNAGTLWASWVNNTVLKGKHFWIQKVPTDCSWIWRKIMRLRSVALQFISYSTADGDLISLWFDPWWGKICLASSTTSLIISQCGSSCNDKVSKLIVNGHWVLPEPNERTHHRDPVVDHWLQSFDFPSLKSGRDTLLWDNLDASKVKTWHIWSSIRSRSDFVPWSQAIWHRLRVNRFAHHQWLFYHRRLNTLSRLHRFGLVSIQQCYLCVCGKEDDNHIFIHCTYSR